MATIMGGDREGGVACIMDRPRRKFRPGAVWTPRSGTALFAPRPLTLTSLPPHGTPGSGVSLTEGRGLGRLFHAWRVFCCGGEADCAGASHGARADDQQGVRRQEKVRAAAACMKGCGNGVRGAQAVLLGWSRDGLWAQPSSILMPRDSRLEEGWCGIAVCAIFGSAEGHGS